MNELIASGQYGRLFAVVHFASHQWKVTAEDLILIENELDVMCGERIRLEKVRLSHVCVHTGAQQPNKGLHSPSITKEVSPTPVEAAWLGTGCSSRTDGSWARRSALGREQQFL